MFITIKSANNNLSIVQNLSPEIFLTIKFIMIYQLL